MAERAGPNGPKARAGSLGTRTAVVLRRLDWRRQTLVADGGGRLASFDHRPFASSSDISHDSSSKSLLPSEDEEMVVIEPEPEPEGEETTTRPSSPPPPPAVDAARAEDDEEDFEDALTDEQLREKARSQANDAKAEGNKHFGAGEYEDALSQYEIALQIAAELESAEDIRSACHSNRAVCFLKLGKYDETIKECTKALELNPSYLKALLRRGEAHEKLEHYDEAIADMKKIIELDPSNEQAKRSLFRLEPLAAEKREKMKEEMLAKLKDLGNSVLGRFGMSVDNFKAVKDPNTGSYSVSFQK